MELGQNWEWGGLVFLSPEGERREYRSNPKSFRGKVGAVPQKNPKTFQLWKEFWKSHGKILFQAVKGQIFKLKCGWGCSRVEGLWRGMGMGVSSCPILSSMYGTTPPYHGQNDGKCNCRSMLAVFMQKFFSTKMPKVIPIFCLCLNLISVFIRYRDKKHYLVHHL